MESVNLPLIIAKYRYAMFWDVEYILKDNIENRIHQYKSFKYTLMELALISQISFNLMRMRVMELGWPIDKAIETPVKTRT